MSDFEIPKIFNYPEKKFQLLLNSPVMVVTQLYRSPL
jgi:hypothetical protein